MAEGPAVLVGTPTPLPIPENQVPAPDSSIVIFA